MAKSILLSLFGALIGSILISLFYTAVRTRWPSNYASSANDLGMIINRTIVRYIAFSLAPTYVICLLVATTARRAGGIALVTAILIGAFRVVYMYIPNIYRTVRYNRSLARTPSIILDTALALSIFAVAYLGSLGPGKFTYLIPPVGDLFTSLWGTIFVAVLAAVVIAKTNVQINVDRLIKRSRREVGTELLEFARNEAVRVKTNPDLVETILLTENLERPRWFRRLERIKGRLFPNGSYGIMQVTSDQPISDKDSITRAVEDHLNGLPLIQGESGYADYDSVQNALKRYNDNVVFIQLGAQIFYTISQPLNKDSPATQTTASPAIPEESEKKMKSSTELTSREQLLSDTTQLFVTSSMNLSTATDDEIRTLNSALDKFLSLQLPRIRRSSSG